MTDVLDRIVPKTNRIPARLRQRAGTRGSTAPAALNEPKKLFVQIRSMLADPFFAANMSRSVVQFVNACDSESPMGDLDDPDFDFEESDDLSYELLEPLSGSTTRILKRPRTSFLDNANRLDKLGQTDAALDIIFDQIDEMLLASKFARVDRLLTVITPDVFSVELLLGLLTVTLPAKNRLGNRASFFEQVRQSLHERGETDEGLLVGLE